VDDLKGHRRSLIVSSLFAERTGTRGAIVGTIATIAVLVLVGWLITRSSGWQVVQDQFLNWDVFSDSFPGIAGAFLTNVIIFLSAEAIVLVFGLLLALMRSLRAPIFFPLRAFSVIYCDVFRGIPAILLIYLLGFGAPALQVTGIPRSPLFWGIVALSLTWSAYVAEVYRAGMDAVPPTQEAAARALGLNRRQAMRLVVLPQAVRHVIPPLLNDFIGLQKDTALIAVLGVVEALRQAQLDSAATFNFTPYVAAAVMFLLITIPLTRFTDWMISRDRRRRLGVAR